MVGEAIALTPPMGWNSWNYLGCEATDAKVRAIGDAFVKLDLINHGWTYVNLDDGWQSRQEHATAGRALSTQLCLAGGHDQIP